MSCFNALIWSADNSADDFNEIPIENLTDLFISLIYSFHDSRNHFDSVSLKRHLRLSFKKKGLYLKPILNLFVFDYTFPPQRRSALIFKSNFDFVSFLYAFIKYQEKARLCLSLVMHINKTEKHNGSLGALFISSRDRHYSSCGETMTKKPNCLLVQYRVGEDLDLAAL
jgi:hypothetical protein